MPSNPITIRNLGPEDTHVLERVRPGTFDNPVEMTHVFEFLATRVNEIVVALDRGEVIGFASGTVLMHPDKTRAFFINEVGVHEDYQRRGIATRLLQRVCELARDRGAENIWLATEKDNAAARGFYRSMGAKETGGIVMYELDNVAL
ncbi:MAG: GNAT family N-acetyltransferase [Silicimonas sp.]|nr:GNAT family N-acetyltransferase [Silicimonas sp.]NNF92235.1 GNAT family N-acetyltransferase [Boseongicola sp.]